MNHDEITIFAETTFRNQFRKFGIKTDDRRRHMYLIGKTGMGKSTLLENMVVEDIRAGRGVVLVDPHGDLAEKIIEYIPSNRVNDVIYFNPADIEYPIAFNVVEQVEPHLRHLVASGLIGVFQKLWADSWGPRLEYILRNTILAILDYPGSTLLAVTRMLSDKAFRKKVIEKIQDPVVKAFWVNEFAGYANNFASEAVSPIQNKVGQFLSSSLIRNIVGQVKSSINLRDVMDQGKILILNLSKGRIGEDNSALLGAMVITKIQLAAMSRVNIREEERKDFYLYIDEFQNFTTDSFANILSEARKYRLNLIMAHQYIEQLGDMVKAAVFGNVGTLVVFRVGAIDAEELVKEFTPTFIEEDLVNLPKYEMYLKLMIDGVASDPFSARGLPPLLKEEKMDNIEKVVKVSRERYANSREEVEDKIMRWHASDEDKKIINNAPVQPAAKERINNFASKKMDAVEAKKPEVYNDIYKYDAKCSRCGKTTKISFIPDGVRPVFCKECLALSRLEKREEFEERKRVKKEELAKVDREELSFAQLKEKKPVDFRGREIGGGKQTVANSNRNEDKENNNESKLSEGEEVRF
ncbi:type IV secretion system DNA-binding domain-containing protein [Patescibacteria group bacterium]|nr:type IV secretion system DNA-binding domain-containing protein [Patescibacteria group bacterium]